MTTWYHDAVTEVEVELTEEERVLEVARLHGTLVASLWSGWSRHRVVSLRRRVDGYARGRGAPSVDELRAARPSLTCPCGRCADLRASEMARSSWRHVATRPRGVKDPGGRWWERGTCRGLAVERWFPVDSSMKRPESRRATREYDELRPLCHGCAVQTECLLHALTNENAMERYGLWGGTSPHQRQDLMQLLSDGQTKDEGTEDG